MNKIVQEPNWPFVSFWKIKSLYFTNSHSLSFVLSLAVRRCHSWSLFVARCHSLSLVVIHCHSLYHSLCRCTNRVTRCHSLPLVFLYINDRYFHLWLSVKRNLFNFIKKHLLMYLSTVVYKKTDEWYIEWQRVAQRVTTNDSEWQRMITSGARNDNEW